jgi:hypothetical protein
MNRKELLELIGKQPTDLRELLLELLKKMEKK